ncbi:MAG: class I SAM-dependent methyltransferase [Rhodoblastus sp.]
MPFVAYRAFGWTPVEITAEWGLRDLKPGMGYNVCASVLCRDCGMLFLDMRFDDEEMGGLYSDYRGEAYTAARDRFEPGYAARNALLLDGSKYVARIEAFLRPHLAVEKPRILDWGGDTGVNTPFRTQAACHDIYDISSRPPLSGARMVAHGQAKSRSYDLVVFANVLEHVPKPREALSELADAMNADTLLYVEVPHEDAIRLIAAPDMRLKSKRHWHEHINFFTQKALEIAFRDAGLTIRQIVSHPVTAGGKDSFVFSIAARRA